MKKQGLVTRWAILLNWRANGVRLVTKPKKQLLSEVSTLFSLTIQKLIFDCNFLQINYIIQSYSSNTSLIPLAWKSDPWESMMMPGKWEYAPQVCGRISFQKKGNNGNAIK